MNTRTPVAVLSLAASAVLVLTLSCAHSSGRALPKSICGTPVDPDLIRPLVPSGKEFREYDRVDRSEAVSAPCVLLADNKPVVDLHFWWTAGPVDFKYMAEETGSVSRVTDARAIASPYKAVVGTDGALAATPCKTRGGSHFTLTLQLPRVRLTDQSHRKDIEKFMRAYFPATVGTLGCS